MQGPIGIILLIVVASVVGAVNENIRSDFQEQDCDDCDDEMNEIQSLKSHGEIRLEEQAKMRRKPFCEKKNRGWGGKCSVSSTELLGWSCNVFWNNTNNHAGRGGVSKKLCHRDDQACCVDCESKAQQDICWKKRNFSIARGRCCPSELQVCSPSDSGCVCCKHCKRKRGCRLHGQRGFCVTDYDPIHNRTSCIDKGGIIKQRACMGIGCFCCVLPAIIVPPTTKTTTP